jgi:RNA polymerase sigma-32 factor
MLGCILKLNRLYLALLMVVLWHPLLDFSGDAVKTLNYREAINEPMMTPTEEVDVIHAWHTRREARALDRLVRSHARLAYSIASRYSRNPDHVEDLAQQGIIGLMKAAEKFNPTLGTRFATYARWWVTTEVSTAASRVSTVVDIPSKTFLEAKMQRLPEGRQELAQMAAFGAVALDAPLGEDGDSSAMDMLECPRPNPEEMAIRNGNETFYRKAILKAMEGLKPRERMVLVRRRLSEEPETLEQIAKDLMVTRERVRQIEMIAMGKLTKAIMAMDIPKSVLR